MKTLRVSYGLSRLRCGFSFHFLGDFQVVIQGEGSLPKLRLGPLPESVVLAFTMDAGYRGRVAPCQRERSDRASDAVT